eukprot:gnl/TRDRNA2_/TRDRNA2_151756_c1_seq4.p3 gnl/TRDRNA2_/TRDRNA2_151756_c1~~gnl/TRDRNA2_/TRDRNA2_151756_c1_seq4.p3  ORF type:complete len:100 (+),score=17.58 gnl/TRDRNA2_/TRDRNA2_151756_c1_seq4:311-610(+)
MQEIANTAWAFATMKESAVFATLATTAMWEPSEFNTQQLANTTWAFAKINWSDERPFMTLARAAKNLVHQFTEQGLANTVWAFATVKPVTREARQQVSM